MCIGSFLFWCFPVLFSLFLNLPHTCYMHVGVKAGRAHVHGCFHAHSHAQFLFPLKSVLQEQRDLPLSSLVVSSSPSHLFNSVSFWHLHHLNYWALLLTFNRALNHRLPADAHWCLLAITRRQKKKRGVERPMAVPYSASSSSVKCYFAVTRRNYWRQKTGHT